MPAGEVVQGVEEGGGGDVPPSRVMFLSTPAVISQHVAQRPRSPPLALQKMFQLMEMDMKWSQVKEL